MWRALMPSSPSTSSRLGRTPTQNSPYRALPKNSLLSRSARGRK